MATLTSSARAFTPVMRVPYVVAPRHDPPRRHRGRLVPVIRDVPALAIAVASILVARAATVTGRSPGYLLAVAATLALSFPAGFASVLAIRGDVHLPGVRTLASVAARASTLWGGTAAAFVPAPPGMDGAPPRIPGARQAAPGTDGTGAGQGGPGAPPASDAPGATPTAVPTPAPDLPKPPPSARLKAVTHVWQTWNNCGPATVTMALSAVGRAETQPAAVAYLKTSANDKNVNPDELVDYVRSRGARTEWRTGGDLTTLKRLLAAGVPVITEVGFEPDAGNWMGHYRLLVGYDDAPGRFIAYDSYLGPGQNVPQPYAPFDANWRAFNRTYLPVYLPSQAAAVAAITGAPDDPSQWERALARAVADAEANPDAAFAWFNVGTSLVRLGQMDEATIAFDQARRLKLPWRMLWYQFGPFEAYLAAGRIDDVLTLSNASLAQVPDIEEIQYYRGRAMHALGRVAEARTAYRLAIQANARFAPAHHFLSLLPR